MRKTNLNAGALITAAALAIASCSIGAQQGQMFHPDIAPRPSFEVATIKPNDDPRPGLNFALSVGNFSAKQATLKDLLMLAYNFRSDDQVIGISPWMTSARFDIKAKASDADIQAFTKLGFQQKLEEVRLMLQSLLAERFALKVSFKTADLPVYALVVAKDGPKMKEVEISAFPPPGTPAPPGSHLPGIRPTGPNQITATAWPMNEMAQWLSHFNEIGNRVVVDETGLKGYYDFVLNSVSQQYPEPTLLNGSPVDATSIFTALPEQLGLKLEARKAPVEVLVIDHAEQPSAN
jgi:uncharacterized protein (TIGR03435 family)